MLRSLASRVVAPRLAAAARAPTSRLIASQRSAARLSAIRSFATATAPTTASPASTSASTPSAGAYSASSPADALTAEERNQAEWEEWEQAKMNIYVLSTVVGGVFLVNYWYKREYEHFKHHRHQQEPYAFFIKRDDQVAAGFWPGRACQFLEFNCFAAVYDTAEKMLEEKKNGGAHHDDGHGEKEHH